MLSEIVAAVSSFILMIIEYSGYAGIFFLMFLESANIPAPSEIIMPFSGFLASRGVFQFWLVVLAGTFGNLAGSFFSYWLGLRWGRRALPYLRFLLIGERDIAAAEKWFLRFGNAAVFLSRLTPVVRTFISFPAGVFCVPPTAFAVYTFLGSLLWSLFLTYLGLILGENWDILGEYFRLFDGVFVVAGLILFSLWIYRHFSQNSKRVE
jgi:membrane protein DedA with SNARE-associated domain